VTSTVHAAPVVITMTGEPLQNGAVLVEDGIVAAVGPRSDFEGHRIRDWPGVMTPGLVNAHAHLEYGPPFAHLSAGGLDFGHWISSLSGIRRGLSDTDWQVAARGSAHQLLKSGTTAVADLVTVGPGLTVATSLGLQGISYVEMVGVDAVTWPAAKQKLEDLLGQSGRQRGVSPHTLYTLSTEVFRDLAVLARDRGLRIHTHLAEPEAEAEWVLSGTGPFSVVPGLLGVTFELAGVGSGLSPVGQCDALGALGADVHVAHGVHVDAADRALLRERQTSVALCVRSNAVLAVGAAPVAAYLTEGTNVAIGTDSLASCPDLDLLAEARAVRDLARKQGLDDPEELIVRALTLGGAEAMGLPLGTITPGSRADLAVFDVPTKAPFKDLVEHGAGRCVATVLGGRLVHRR
jgi:cytosine/adenosine deaminase-related metal-dependent hydrolase